MNDAELARNYILDRLPEEDRDACERRFLFDPEFEAVMLEQEHTLLDDYVNSRLNEDDAKTVLHRVAQEPGHLYRLRFAESLRRAAMAAANGPAEAAAREKERRRLFRLSWRSLQEPRKLVWFGGLAGMAAAAIVLVVAVSVERRQHPAQAVQIAPSTVSPPHSPAAGATTANEQAQPQSMKPNGPAQTQRAMTERTMTQQSVTQQSIRAQGSNIAASSMATFVLMANEQRGDSDEPAINLKPGVALLRLQLTTEEGLAAGSYSATVRDDHGEKVSAAAHLPARIEAGRRYVDLRLAAAMLSSGSYTVELAQETEGPAAPILSYRFTLAAPRPETDLRK